MRLRVKYSISGKIRFISHLDLMRAFFRTCIKNDIPVAITQGFSPHLKISFGPPLSVGMTSRGEYLDMQMKQSVDSGQCRSTCPNTSRDKCRADPLTFEPRAIEKHRGSYLDPKEIIPLLQDGLPEGIKIEDVTEVSDDLPSLGADICRAVYKVKIPSENRTEINERIKKLFDSGQYHGHAWGDNFRSTCPDMCRDKCRSEGSYLDSAGDQDKINPVRGRPPDVTSGRHGRSASNGVKKIKELTFNGEELIMNVPIGQNGNVRPFDVLTNLWPELGQEELKLWHIHREELYR